MCLLIALAGVVVLVLLGVWPLAEDIESNVALFTAYWGAVFVYVFLVLAFAVRRLGTVQREHRSELTRVEREIFSVAEELKKGDYSSLKTEESDDENSEVPPK